MMNVSPRLTVWLIEILVNRSQVVKYQNVLSQVKATSTGTPSFAPVLLPYTLVSLRAVAPCVVCTSTVYSDETDLVDFQTHSHFQLQVVEVTRWCKDNYFHLDVDKTREVAVDLRKKGGCE